MRDWKNLHSRWPSIASVLTLIALSLTASRGETRGSDALTEVVQLDRAQRAVNALQARLGLSGEVVAELVPRHPLIVAVAPRGDRRGSYRLKLEAAFVGELTDEELDAVVAHELGHVWIFSHHPYLQTEQLANQVAMRVVSRDALESVYRKVESRGGKKAVVTRFADSRRRR
jgi:hypothetical protein